MGCDGLQVSSSADDQCLMMRSCISTHVVNLSRTVVRHLRVVSCLTEMAFWLMYGISCLGVDNHSYIVDVMPLSESELDKSMPTKKKEIY